MIILDTLLIGGIRFVLGKIVDAVDAELNDDSVLREELLAAQMRVELGEMTEAEYAVVERDILARLRELRERTQGPAPAPGELRVTGVEATFGDEDASGGPDMAPAPPDARRGPAQPSRASIQRGSRGR